MQNELLCAQAIGVGYGQYTALSGGVPNRHGNFLRRVDRWSLFRSTSLYRQKRSRSPYLRSHRDAEVPPLNPRWNPNAQRKRIFYGCGSDQHILSDFKCTMTVQSIKTHITQLHGYENKVVNTIAEEFFTLFLSQKMVQEKLVIGLLRRRHGTPLETQQFNIKKTLYDVQEQSTLQN